MPVYWLYSTVLKLLYLVMSVILYLVMPVITTQNYKFPNIISSIFLPYPDLFIKNATGSFLFEAQFLEAI